MKRTPDLPSIALDLADLISKADMLETVWDLAAVSNGVGADDDVATARRVLEVLNAARERRGQRPLVLTLSLREALKGALV